MEHHCTIETTTSGRFYPGHPGYYAECDICGHLMDPTGEPRNAHRRINVHLAALDPAATDDQRRADLT